MEVWLVLLIVGPVVVDSFCGYSHISKCIIEIDVLRSWKNSHTLSLSGGVKDIVIGKTKWKRLKLPLPKKIVNQNQYHVFGRIVEISTNIKDLKDAGVPTTLSFNSFICPVENTDGLWKMTVESKTQPGSSSNYRCYTRLSYPYLSKLTHLLAHGMQLLI